VPSGICGRRRLSEKREAKLPGRRIVAQLVDEDEGLIFEVWRARGVPGNVNGVFYLLFQY
jgi:hypothetical protein